MEFEEFRRWNSIWLLLHSHEAFNSELKCTYRLSYMENGDGAEICGKVMKSMKINILYTKSFALIIL